MEKYTLNTIEYDLVGAYKNGENAIRILRDSRDGLYYIDNYEGIKGLYMGPYADAVKTGDNGEVLVKDAGKDYYYVPDPEVTKPYDVGFRKTYYSKDDPKNQFAEPYTYEKPRLYTPVKMVDGNTRLKWSDGRLSEEAYDYYDCDPNTPFLDYYGKEGKSFVSSYDITLPLASDGEKNAFTNEDFLIIKIAKEYAAYIKGERELNSFSHHAVMNDTVLEKILENEKRKLKAKIAEAAQAAEKEVGNIADSHAPDLTKIKNVHIDKDLIKAEINRVYGAISRLRELGEAVKDQQEEIRKEAEGKEEEVEETFSLDAFKNLKNRNAEAEMER